MEGLSIEQQPSWVTNTVTFCSCLYFVVASLRYLALRTTVAALEIVSLLTPSPFHLGLIAFGAVGSAAYIYGGDRLGLYAPRLVNALATHAVLSPPAPSASRASSSASSPRSHSSIPSLGSTPGSPFKDISSFRVPDHSLKSSPRRSSSSSKRRDRSRSRRTFSLDLHGSASRVELTLKPRTSLDFDTKHVRTPTKRDQGSCTRRQGSSRRRNMPRIASGQELAAQQQDARQSFLQEINNSSPFAPGTPPNEPAVPSHSAEDASLLGADYLSMAAISNWTASTFSWQSLAERADSLFRPLVPGPATLESLKRWNSAPSSWRFKPAPGSHDGNLMPGHSRLASPRGDGGERRASLEGPTVRHYCHGAVTAAEEENRESLVRCAVDARNAAPQGSAATLTLQVHHGRVAQVSGNVGTSALASVGLDGDCPHAIREYITDEHLLQFAALAGDELCQQVVLQLGLSPAYGEEGSLYGVPDEESFGQDWELIIDQSRPGLTVRAWRLPLKSGLYLYRQSAVIGGATPRDVRPFHIDDQAREIWDDGAVFIKRVLPPGASRLSKHAESCLHKYTSRFPRPMAPREYNYARRVWHRPSDGGCYVICKAMNLPQDAEAPRAVQVTDYTSCALIRAVSGGTEVATFYFEDSHIRPGLAKMGVPKGLWPFWTKYTDALTVFAQARKTAASLPQPPRHHRRSLEGTHAPWTAAADRESSAAVLAKGGMVPTFVPGAIRSSGVQVPTHRPAFDDGEESDTGSEDDVYDMLQELKHLRQGRIGGAGPGASFSSVKGSTTRWARRLLIAGAIRMLQISLNSS